MQIVAKALLFILGIWLFSILLNDIKVPTLVYRDDNYTRFLAYTISILLLLVIALCITIFNSNTFTQKIVGPGDKLTGPQLNLWFTTALRLAAVFSGLVLIIYNLPHLLAILEFPFRHIRPFITQVFIYKQTPDLLQLPIRTTVPAITNTIKIIVAVYLVFGAPHYVKSQLNLLANSERKYS